MQKLNVKLTPLVGLDMVRGGQGDDMVYADAQVSVEIAANDVQIRKAA